MTPRIISHQCTEGDHGMCRSDRTACECLCAHRPGSARGLLDPRCRFVRSDPDHRCLNAQGWPINQHQACAHEARQQLIDAADRGVLSYITADDFMRVLADAGEDVVGS